MNKRKIRRIVRAIAPNLKVTFKKYQGCYYSYLYDKINIDFTDIDRNRDGGFFYHLKHSHKCDWCDDIPFVIWSVLHEIGHYFTLDDIEEDFSSSLIKMYCAEISVEEAQADPNIAKMYFNLPEEWVATEWAINYIVNHPKMVELLSLYCGED